MDKDVEQANELTKGFEEMMKREYGVESYEMVKELIDRGVEIQYFHKRTARRLEGLGFRDTDAPANGADTAMRRLPWTCLFCGSRGFWAFWRWMILDTRKLHKCKR